MSRISTDVWAKLEMARPAGERLVARPGVPDVTERLLCAIDAQGERHLLITLEGGDADLHDAQSRGVSVVTRELLVHGEPAVRYLDIECRDISGYPALDLVGNELAQELAQPSRQPAEVARRILAKWRRFWGQIPRSLLTREELLGLFGEIWFLRVWLVPRVGPSDAVLRWRGPRGSRHDFEWTGKSVEVKATSSARGRIHRIHGLDQLEPPEGGQLFLFSMQLREESGASNSLPSLIALARQDVEPDADALGRLETALLQCGYSPAHDDEYAKIRLRVVEEGLFTVAGDFPRLTARTFPGGLPAGIESVQYEINLNGHDHLCVARSSEAAAGFVA
jgi:hypothetical protein